MSPAHEISEVPIKLFVFVFTVELFSLLLGQVAVLAQRHSETSFFNLLENMLCARIEWRFTMLSQKGIKEEILSVQQSKDASAQKGFL